MSTPDPIVCVVGPTATGKSDLAIKIAEHLEACIISADSMQIYKGMDIGTAKVPLSERTVEHFGLDLIDPGEPYSAALYQRYARGVIEGLDSDGKGSVMVGGTGFYVKAVIDDMDFAEGEQSENPIRDRYRAFYEDKGAHALWEHLRSVDPDSASVIHENDVKRVIRAFELLEAGDSYHRRFNELKNVGEWRESIQLGLSVEPELLRTRIDARVDKMREIGLVSEVEGLLDKGFREGLTAPQAIGYKEIVDAIDGKLTIDEAFDKIKTATKRYAKRQRTWFRKDKRIKWLDADLIGPDCLFERAIEVIEKENTRI